MKDREREAQKLMNSTSAAGASRIDEPVVSWIGWRRKRNQGAAARTDNIRKRKLPMYCALPWRNPFDKDISDTFESVWCKTRKARRRRLVVQNDMHTTPRPMYKCSRDNVERSPPTVSQITVRHSIAYSCYEAIYSASFSTPGRTLFLPASFIYHLANHR